MRRGWILMAWGISSLALLVATSAGAQDEGAKDPLLLEYVAAGEAYRDGRFEEAQRRYGGLVLAGWRNGELFFNLGNTYFQTGELGEAVRAYRRAERYLPRNADLRHNQALAEGTVVDAFSRGGFAELLSTTAFWYERSTLRELTWAAVVTWWLLCAALAAVFLRPGTASRAAAWSAAALFGVVGASASAKAWVLHRTDPAIVLVERAEVRAGPSYQESITSKLSEGNAVEIIGEEGAYLRVALPDDSEGWVRASALGRIALD